MAQNDLVIKIPGIDEKLAKKALVSLNLAFITLDNRVKSFDTGVASLNKNLRKLPGLKNLIKLDKKAAEETKKLTAVTKTQTVAVQKGARVADAAARKRKRRVSEETFGRRRGGGGILASQLAQVIVNIPGLDRATAGLSGLAGEAARGTAGIGRLASVSKGASKTLIVLGLAAAAAAIGVAITTAAVLKGVGAFAQYEEALVKVGKVADLEGEQLSALGVVFANLSTRIPVAATELLQFAEVAAQLGIRGTQNLTIFAITMAKLAAASDLAGEEGARSLVRIAQLTNFDISNVDKLASAMVELGNNFATTESRIATTAQRVAQELSPIEPLAQDVLALGTAISALGIRSERGATALGRIFITFREKVLDGGKAVESLALITGKSTEELRKLAIASEPKEILNLIAATGNARAVIKALGIVSTETTGVITTLSNNIDLVNEAFDRADTRTTIALNKEAAKAFATLNSRVAKLRNTIKAAFVLIGEKFAPAIARLVDVTKEAIEAIFDMNEAAVLSFPILSRLGTLFRAVGDAVKFFGSQLKNLGGVLIPKPLRDLLSPEKSAKERFQERKAIEDKAIRELFVSKVIKRTEERVSGTRDFSIIEKELAKGQKILDQIFKRDIAAAEERKDVLLAAQLEANIPQLAEVLTKKSSGLATIIKDSAKLSKVVKGARISSNNLIGKLNELRVTAEAEIETIGLNALEKQLFVLDKASGQTAKQIADLQDLAAGLFIGDIGKTALEGFVVALTETQKELDKSTLIKLTKEANVELGKLLDTASRQRALIGLEGLTKELARIKQETEALLEEAAVDELGGQARKAIIEEIQAEKISGAFQKATVNINKLISAANDQRALIGLSSFERKIVGIDQRMSKLRKQFPQLKKELATLNDTLIDATRDEIRIKLSADLDVEVKKLRDIEAGKISGIEGAIGRLGNLFDDSLKDFKDQFEVLASKGLLDDKTVKLIGKIFDIQTKQFIEKEAAAIAKETGVAAATENVAITSQVEAEKFIAKAFADARARQFEREAFDVTKKNLEENVKSRKALDNIDKNLANRPLLAPI